jgi:anti-anti-sigma factor
MEEDTIRIDVSHHDDGVVMMVQGEIDMVSVPVLRAAMNEFSLDQHEIVDCAGVQFIDSTGLNLIVTQALHREERGGSLRLRRMSFPVLHVVEITGLIQLVELDDDHVARKALELGQPSPAAIQSPDSISGKLTAPQYS